MGHRALVAYQVRPDEYDVRYSHWGAARLQLKHEITADQPYADGMVDEDIRDDDWRRVSLETIKDGILRYGDHEALYLVSDDFEVTAFAVEGYELSRYTGTDTRANDRLELPDYNSRDRGVCFPVRWHEGDAVSMSLDRGKIRGYCESAAVMLENGGFDSAGEAVDFIHERVRERFMGATGGASRYDEPMLSSEDSPPLSLQPSAQSLSDMMTDGGQPQGDGQQSISDF